MKKQDPLENIELISKFLAGEINDSELNLLRSWLIENTENRHSFDAANEVWQETDLKAKIEWFKTDQAWSKISQKLWIKEGNTKSVALLSRIHYRALIAAASVACLLSLGGLSLWIAEKMSFWQIADASTIVATNEGEKSHIFLTDSTKIFLNSGSTLQYNGHYNIKDRNIRLTGEAFFDIRTNPEKPFIVQIGQMSIFATGTRFNVSSYSDDDRVETTLEEGQIHVSIQNQKDIQLKAGQQLVYLRNSKKTYIRDVATDTYTAWKENKLRFHDTPFAEVMRKLSRKYNVKIEILNRDLLNLKYTATFIDEPINKVMQMLEEVSPITYKIYNRTSVNDKQYIKPRIVVGQRKNSVIK